MSQTIPQPASPPSKMTYEEFLEWADGERRVEWVNGEVVFMSPVSYRHQYIADFLTALFRFFIEFHRLGTVLSAPFQMKTGKDLPGREPDVMFVSTARLHQMRENYLDGPADLVVEVISPDSRARDRKQKYNEYEKGGVLEYWLIDPIRKWAEFYQLGADGLYHLVPVGEDRIYRSAVLSGLWLRVDWLWQETLPSLFDVLREWKLI
jgi:Uma2 family endonuclease